MFKTEQLVIIRVLLRFLKINEFIELIMIEIFR